MVTSGCSPVMIKLDRLGMNELVAVFFQHLPDGFHGQVAIAHSSPFASGAL